MADTHLAISTGIRRELIACGIAPDSVALVFDPVSASDVVIPRSDACRFLYVGRVTFTGQKCLKDLFDAAWNLLGDWTLDIVGMGEDIVQCQQYVDQLGIADRITWHGWQQDPWEYVASRIGKVTSLVQCSSYEGFSLVLAESLMRGVYCIASDCESGPADIIEHGVNGLLFKPHDVDGLHSIMQQLIDGREMPSASKLKQSVAKHQDDVFVERFYRALCQFVDQPETA